MKGNSLTNNFCSKKQNIHRSGQIEFNYTKFVLIDETPRLVPVTIYTDEETHLYSRKTTEGTTKKWSIKFGLSHNNTVYTCNDGGRIVLGKTEARAQLVFDSKLVSNI